MDIVNLNNRDMKPIDEFAKAAMIALIQSRPIEPEKIKARAWAVATLAYEFAEAMEAERVKRNQKSE